MTGVDLLVVGGTGLLGRSIVSLAAAQGRSVSATFHSTTPAGDADWHALDIRRPKAIADLVADLRPRAIINAAYVQGGEDLDTITTQAPAALAAAAKRLDCRFVHLSTDIVFDGRAGRPYTEADSPSPVNNYGRAKADAEEAVFSHDASTIVVRTSLLWSSSGDGGQQVRLVRDPTVKFFTNEIRCPIRVDRLAAACLELCDRSDITGVLNVAGKDAVDRLSFARALAPLAGVDPAALVGVESPPSIDRAPDCRLDSALARDLLDSPLPGIHDDAT